MTSPLLLTRSVLRNERIFWYEYLKILEQTLSLNNPISRNLQNFFWARSECPRGLLHQNNKIRYW